jgi:SAM-dependent methyltransferase
MNGAELYSLGRMLTAIADDALPAESVLRQITPGDRLVLEDVAGHPGTTVDDIAGRTGLLASQVIALVRDMAARELTASSPGAGGGRVTLGSAVLSGGDTAVPVDAAVAAALGTAHAAELGETLRDLEALARRLGRGAEPDPAFFDAAYQGTPPWEIGHPQRALAELLEAGAVRGRVLDVGCGTGEHALLAASMGLEATGIDAAPTAIEIARRKAAERGLAARFDVRDALDLGALAQRFDTVIDSALFHVFSDDALPRYEAGLREVLAVGGRYLMICFSDRQPPGYGPRRVRREDIEAVFGAGWRIDAIEPATLEVTIDQAGVRAWRVEITRV